MTPREREDATVAARRAVLAAYRREGLRRPPAGVVVHDDGSLSLFWDRRGGVVVREFRSVRAAVRAIRG